MSSPKIPKTGLDTIRQLLEQQDASRAALVPVSLVEQLRALRELPSARIVAEHERMMRELVAPVQESIAAAQRAFAPVLELVESARASIAQLDRVGLAGLTAGLATEQTAVTAALGSLAERERTARAFLGTFAAERTAINALIEPEKLASPYLGGLEALGGIADQSRALLAIGSASESLTAIFERENLAMLHHERLAGGLDSIYRSVELSLRAVDQIAKLPFESIGQLAGFDSVARDGMVARFSTFAESYQGLADCMRREVPRPWELPDFVTERPARELLASADVLRAVSSTEATGDQREATDEPDDDTPLPDLLAELHPELPCMLRGARHVLRDAANPDRVRHAATSIVELCDHVLLQAAPDDLVKPWASSQHFLPDGRLKRSARWAYLTRNIRGVVERFDPVMEASVDDMLGIIQELQSGKHRLQHGLSSALIRVLLARVDGALRTIYIVWKYERR